MPSPFPGMDPYLEGSLWSSVHAALSVEIARQLAPRLRPRYLALTEKRFVLDAPDPDESISISAAHQSSVYLDVALVEARGAPALRAAGVIVAPIELETLMPEQVPVHTVEIRDVAHRKLVTAIEVLSPVNKRGEGRKEYLQRRLKLLQSTAHLMEIDLLRAGQRVPMREPLPDSPYFVFLSRAGRRPLTQVWPVSLEQPLPTVPVPLLPEDPDVLLNLQEALTRIYDDLGYDLAIDYTHPAEVKLSPGESAWAEALLRAHR